MSNSAATLDAISCVPAGHGEHHAFLNHVATIKVAPTGADSGLALVEFRAPRGFGPPLHLHAEEDEVMYVLDGEIRLDPPDGRSTTATAGAVVVLPCGVAHTWQVVSDEARFLTINAGRRSTSSFDIFVRALGRPMETDTMPTALPIDPQHVATVCADHGITVLGPPPALD